MTNVLKKTDAAKELIEMLEQMRAKYWQTYLSIVSRRRSDAENKLATSISELAEICRKFANQLRAENGIPVVQMIPTSNVKRPENFDLAAVIPGMMVASVC